MEQIIFPSEINKAETRRAVEERLESARIYKQIGFIRRETRTTAFTKPVSTAQRICCPIRPRILLYGM